MIKISADDLSDGKIIALLELHRQEMFKHSPPESVHALDVEAMHNPEMSFYRAELNGQFAACGAIKHHSSSLAELKSMKTMDEFLRKGIAAKMLDHLIDIAKQRGYQNLCLETGTMDAFIAARTLYQQRGFVECAPFGDYRPDPHSVCMKLDLR